jgi:hypothetical protein
MAVPLIVPVALRFKFDNPLTAAGLGPRWRTLLTTGAAGRATPGVRTAALLWAVPLGINPPFAAATGLFEPD